MPISILFQVHKDHCGNFFGSCRDRLHASCSGEPTPEEIEADGIEQDNDVFFLVNSTEVRMVGFAMDPVDLPPRPAAHKRHRTRGASSAPERAETEGRRFRLPADVENQGLAKCW